MNTYQVICLIGLPVITTSLMTYLLTKMRSTVQSTKALRSGVQALLRDRLYQCYRECANKGYATFYERENFINMYEQYHSLGVNGVMNDIRDKFLNLPVQKGE